MRRIVFMTLLAACGGSDGSGGFNPDAGTEPDAGYPRAALNRTPPQIGDTLRNSSDGHLRYGVPEFRRRLQ
jgi:hypothetical protein